MRSFNPVYTQALGTGAGGGAFWGTQAAASRELEPLLGFYLVAPLLYIRNATTLPPLNTVLQATSLATSFDLEQADVTFNYARKVAVTLANLYPSNTAPTSGPQRWSTLVVFTSPSTFEVFALIWTQAGSYRFVGALTAFAVLNGFVASAGPTTLTLTVLATAAAPPSPDAGTPGPSPFFTSAALRSGVLLKADRSPALQNWVLGAS